jgi:hypothetical protein
MPRSARFRELQTRITELRQRVLPKSFDPTGSYPARIHDRARGFRLLAHAEIEACLEDLAVDTVNAVYTDWLQDRRPRTTLTALATFSEKRFSPPEALPPDPKALPLRMRLDEARKAYVTWVKMKNNGIREENVLRILLPVGIREFELDAAWLATIDSFGQARGATAHSAGRPQTPPDPAAELQTVRDIVKGITPLDRRLNQLKNE